MKMVSKVGMLSDVKADLATIVQSMTVESVLVKESTITDKILAMKKESSNLLRSKSQT